MYLQLRWTISLVKKQKHREITDRQKVTRMQWTLDMERKEIKLNIQDEVLGSYLKNLRTERC